MLDVERTISELKHLRELTGNEDGAQRVAFTETWARARAWCRTLVEGFPITSETDEAGNLWFTLKGDSQRTLIIGGHLDSVPNGGWLDGCLNVLAGIEIMRQMCRKYDGRPPITIRVVDWADEEGARFGKSLFGSSACSGNLNLAEARTLVDAAGISLTSALQIYGIDLETAHQAGSQLRDAAVYIELHIEQGPVLLDMDLSLGAVLGTFGVERHAITFRGQAAHSGSTPMNRRKDALLASANMCREIYAIAERSHGGVCTIGSCVTHPGIVTSVVETCRITLDQRHLDADALARMLEEARVASEQFASEAKVSVAWERIWSIAPQPFHPQLIDFCEEAIIATCGRCHRLPSGPLHDAAEVASASIPTVMMFVQSLHGISHNKIEDTREEHLIESVIAFDRLAQRTLEWIQTNPE